MCILYMYMFTEEFRFMKPTLPCWLFHTHTLAHVETRQYQSMVGIASCVPGHVSANRIIYYVCSMLHLYACALRQHLASYHLYVEEAPGLTFL